MFTLYVVQQGGRVCTRTKDEEEDDGKAMEQRF